MGASNRVVFSSAPDQEAIARAKEAALDSDRMVSTSGLRQNQPALSGSDSAAIEALFSEGDDPLAKKAGETAVGTFKRRRSVLGSLRRGL